MESKYEINSSWCNGKTKHQFINSNMNELNKSGWMSNREDKM